MRKVLRWSAIAMAAHLVFYAFTGLAAWGIEPDFARGMVLYFVHVGVFVAALAEYLHA